MKTLFRISYIDEMFTEIDNDAYILCNGFPSLNELKRRLNMLAYSGKEMSNEDYKEFIINAGNHIKFNIENIEEIKTIVFDN